MHFESYMHKWNGVHTANPYIKAAQHDAQIVVQSTFYLNFYVTIDLRNDFLDRNTPLFYTFPTRNINVPGSFLIYPENFNQI